MRSECTGDAMTVAQLEKGGHGQVGASRVAAHDDGQSGEAGLQPAHRLDNLGDHGWDRHCVPPHADAVRPPLPSQFQFPWSTRTTCRSRTGRAEVIAEAGSDGTSGCQHAVHVRAMLFAACPKPGPQSAGSAGESAFAGQGGQGRVCRAGRCPALRRAAAASTPFSNVRPVPSCPAAARRTRVPASSRRECTRPLRLAASAGGTGRAARPVRLRSAGRAPPRRRLRAPLLLPLCSQKKIRPTVERRARHRQRARHGWRTYVQRWSPCGPRPRPLGACARPTWTASTAGPGPSRAAAAADWTLKRRGRGE